jgi:hypothetical protein
LYALTLLGRFSRRGVIVVLAFGHWPEAPFAQLQCAGEWRVANGRRGHRPAAHDKGIAMPIDLDAPGQLHPSPRSARSGKLSQTQSSAAIEGDPRARRDRRPERTQCFLIIVAERGRSNAQRPVAHLGDERPRDMIHREADRRRPACDIEQLVAE